MNFVTFGWIVGSIASSTSIIVINKMLMDERGFSSPIFLTTYHFFLTWLLLEIMCRLKLFERATNFPETERWIMGFFGVSAVIFMNLNLQINSVGFYQLSKLCCIPFMVGYNFIVEHKITPVNTLVSLVILLIGIGIFSINDVRFSLVGTIIAIIAVICVSVFQMKTGSKQHQYNIVGVALQHSTALPQFVIAAGAACATETYGKNNIFKQTYTLSTTLLLILTGFIAVSVNVCSFGLIGKTSAVTYQVVGHMKSILIFIFGVVFLDRPISETKEMQQKKVIGLVVSMTGCILYSIFEMKNKEKETKKEDENPILAKEEEELQEAVPESLPPVVADTEKK